MRMKPSINQLILCAMLTPAMVLSADDARPFARVGEVELTQDDFERAVSRTIRSRFYHGRIPEDTEEAVRAEVADELINEALLLGEADRRGIEANEEAIETAVARYDVHYAGNPSWQENREAMLSRLVRDLRNEERLARLEAEVRRVPPPSQTQLQSYYAAHRGEFTEPAQIRVSLILLGVAPSATGETWAAAFQEAEKITDKLDQGADFAELARLHSSDDSAAIGGDMGYLHNGMLGEAVQQALEASDPGDHTDPIQVLEGVAILRLEERRAARLREFRDVRQRAQELWLREQGNRAWALLIKQLRESTTISVYEIPPRVPTI